MSGLLGLLCANRQGKTWPSIGLLVFRVVMGSAFILHGLGKIQMPFGWMGDAPVPGALQALAAVAEFGGGLALVVGFLTPVAALALVGTMLGAMLLVHWPSNHPFVNSEGPSYELALMYLASALMLFFNGAGRFSLDAVCLASKPDQSPETANP